jgi:hypothetical protein
MESCIEDLLCSRGIYWVSSGIEIAPLNALKKSKWYSKNDEACGLIGMLMSSDLQFYLQGV